MDNHRLATERGRYLARTTDLRRPEARAIAYAEFGFSHNGIAKQIETSESTVKDYLERAMALYGLEITKTLLPDKEPPDYDRVEPTYHRTLEFKTERQKWIKYVDRHQNRLPQEWVNSVLKTAEEDDMYSIKAES